MLIRKWSENTDTLLAVNYIKYTIYTPFHKFICEKAFMKQVPQEKEIIIPLLKILFIILSCKMELCYSSVVAILVIRIHRKRRNTKSTLSAFFAYLIHICRFSVFFFFFPFLFSPVWCLTNQSLLRQVRGAWRWCPSCIYVEILGKKIKMNWFLILSMSFL